MTGRSSKPMTSGVGVTMSNTNYKDVDVNNNDELKKFVEGELCYHNTIVNTCFMFHRNGDISYENALLRAIVHLAEKSDALQDELVKSMMRESPESFHGRLLGMGGIAK